MLAPEVQAELATLRPGLADQVAARLAAVALELADNPEAALTQAQEARNMASRLAVVREAYGIAAYHNQDYALAQRELIAARRISGRDDVVPLIVDCLRGLGQPERALAMAAEPVKLDAAGRAELRLTAAGARLDLGQPEAAALLLRTKLLESDEPSDASIRTKYVYAEALLASGDRAGATEWFRRAGDLDEYATTDAGDRARDLSQED